MLELSQNRDLTHRCRGNTVTVIVDLGLLEGNLFACPLVSTLVD